MRKPHWLANSVALCALALFTLPMVLYVIGYFALCKVVVSEPAKHKMRLYPTEWLANLYQPAARFESQFTTSSVHVLYDEDSFR
jgi:hypothetical protein